MAANIADRLQLAVFVVLATLLAVKLGHRARAGYADRAESHETRTANLRSGGEQENGILAVASPSPQTDVASIPRLNHPMEKSGGGRQRNYGDGEAVLTERSEAATVDLSHHGIWAKFKQVGCGVLGPRQTHTLAHLSGTVSLPACHTSCRAGAYRYMGLLEGTECWCSDTMEHIEILHSDVDDPACKPQRLRHTTIFHIEGELQERITMYIAPAKRTSSLFMSGRLERFHSGRYAYRYKRLNAQVFRTEDKFRQEVCEHTPGKKIFVQIAGSVEFLLTHWPEKSVLILTADEIGNWGLGSDDKRFGPHGPGRPFKSNESSEYKHALLPDRVFPIFKQYFDWKQHVAFGNSMRFVPLGSRTEFPDVPPGSILPAPQRKFVYSYMAALTDATRRKVHDILVNDTTISATNRFIHVSQNWHGTANNEEYVSPTQYHDVMLNSMFAICPKGHSVEQFRIYEAIETGAIPVMDLKDGPHVEMHYERYLSQHLPPEYIDSPMLLLDGWDTVVDQMTKLWRDPAALLDRQQKLLAWYDAYMRSKVNEIEHALEARESEPIVFCKQPVKRR